MLMYVCCSSLTVCVCVLPVLIYAVCLSCQTSKFLDVAMICPLILKKCNAALILPEKKKTKKTRLPSVDSCLAEAKREGNVESLFTVCQADVFSDC